MWAERSLYVGATRLQETLLKIASFSLASIDAAGFEPVYYRCKFVYVSGSP